MALFANAACAQQVHTNSKQPSTVIPLDASVRTGKLSNGFTYYIRHNEEPKHRVVMYLANKVGSVLEDDDQQGLAHFMEHMNFNGTAHFPHNDLVNYLQKIGVRFGADLNAYTSFDETVFQLPIPSDKPELVENGLQIMREWAHGATLDPAEIDKERGVVLEEKRRGKGAAERMAREYYPVILNHSRYADRLPIGQESVLNTFKPAAIRRYYNDWYRPDLQALIVVGDVNVDQIEQQIRAKFSDLKNPANEKPRQRYTIPLKGQNQFISVTDQEMPYTQARIFIKRKASPLRTEAQFKTLIVEQLFNRTMRERIIEISQVATPPFLNASTTIGGFLADLNNFEVSVTARPGELEKGTKAIWREIERVKRYGVTQTELERAKASYLELLGSQFNEKNKTASEKFVKEYVQNFLNGTASPGIDYEYGLSKRLIADITINDINRLVSESIKDSNRDVLILAPEKDKDKLPGEATFLSWMKAVEEENIQPYRDNVSELPLLKAQPAPGKIVKSISDRTLGVINITLSNGVKVILKPTDFKNDDIYFNGLSFGGYSWYPDSTFRTAIAANNIPSFGAGNYNSSQLRKYLSGKQVQVVASIGEKTQEITAYTRRQDLAATLELVYARITEPRLDADQFKGLIATEIAAMANDHNNPSAVFLDTMIAAQSNHNPRRMRAKASDLQKINPNQAFEIYKERWADASGLSFMFVGNIDTTIIKPLLEKYLGSLPSSYTNKGFKDLNYYPMRGRMERTVYMGKAPKATVALFFTGHYDYGYKENLIMDALNECLSIKVVERLREAESGVYAPQVLAGGTGASGGWYNIIVQFNCAPENVEKLVACANDEISKILKNGPSETDLQKFKAEEKRKLETSQRTNGYWVNYFKTQLVEGNDFHEILEQDNIINAITTEDVKKMANKYLDYKNYQKFVLMPGK